MRTLPILPFIGALERTLAVPRIPVASRKIPASEAPERRGLPYPSLFKVPCESREEKK
jgi:hypothetical protein